MSHENENENENPNLRIFLTGVGGQGTLLASRLLGEAALAAGINPLVSETHGMAQRGGIVVSTVVLGDLKSPIISPGEADILLGFEALETFRALDRCHPGTLVIANTAAMVPYPVAIGQAPIPRCPGCWSSWRRRWGASWPSTPGPGPPGRQPPGGEHGAVGGPGGHGGVLPFPPGRILAVVRTRTNPKFLEANLAAFALGSRPRPGTPETGCRPLSFKVIVITCYAGALPRPAAPL